MVSDVVCPDVVSRVCVWRPRLKKSNPELFQEPATYLAVCEHMAAYDFPLSSRRLVHSFFDRISFASEHEWNRGVIGEVDAEDSEQ